MKSIRLYLVLALLATICLANFVAAYHGYERSIAAGNRLLDKQLIEMAQSLEQLGAAATPPPPGLFGDNRVYQIHAAQGLLYRSPNAPQQALGTLDPGYHFASHDGLRWRVYVLHDALHDQHIVVGQRADLYARLVEQMVLESILPMVWVLPVIAVLIWLVVSFGLAPLRQLAATLQQRRAGELEPVASAGYPAELAVVIKSINELLGRLGEAFDREQRFAADAAHELRTPLAAVKVSLHNLGREQQLDRTTLAELERSVERMGHSIEQILALYRFTPERLRAASTRCHLRTLVQQVIIDMYDACAARQQNIELDAIDIDIDGNEFALHTLLRNLIDNACKYTPTGGEIRVSLQRDGDQALLIVEDSGPGIPATDYRRVFDRFYRVGGDRHASSVVGSGLGLSIVEHIVRLHGGHIALHTSPQLGGLRVEVRLPARHSRVGGSA